MNTFVDFCWTLLLFGGYLSIAILGVLGAHVFLQLIGVIPSSISRDPHAPIRPPVYSGDDQSSTDAGVTAASVEGISQ